MTNKPQPCLAPLCPPGLPALAVSLVLGVVLAGCLSRPAMVRQTFAFEAGAATQHSGAHGQSVLALESVKVSPLFAQQSFVYRTGPEAYEVDPYAAFLIRPDRAIAIPICDYLRNSGSFQVIESGTSPKADKRLQVSVSELYGDFRQPDRPAAVLSLRLLFLDSGSGGTNRVLLQKDYTRSVSLPKNTAADVMAGWNQALGEIMKEAAADLASAGAGSASVRAP